jgi:uncharacterized RDD family membrane protein YckC
MKCPKCGYLGYERLQRCRNCGYDFVLSSSQPTPDLRLRDADANPTPIEDLELVDASARQRPASPFTDAIPDRQHDQAGQRAVAELPLFGPPITDDVPLITKPSPPRPPLAVRRATPEVPRLRAEPRAPLLEWPSDTQAMPPASAARPIRRPDAPLPQVHAHAGSPAQASLARRGVAAAIDVVLLAAVDVVVIYFTMKICRIAPSEWRMLPKAPLLAFLLLQNGGYLVAFTAVGQTLGKMMAGVRVLADDHDGVPDFGRAALRALLWLPLALPAGLGLLSAALYDDRRGWHDRFAGTRVVSTRA